MARSWSLRITRFMCSTKTCRREVRRITNPLFANLHELAWDGNQIWAASTAIDAAIKVESTGAAVAMWWPREDPLTKSRFGLAPLAIDKRADNRLRFLGVSDLAPGHVHLNAIALNGPRPLVLLNRYGAVVALDPTEVLIERTTSGEATTCWSPDVGT